MTVLEDSRFPQIVPGVFPEETHKARKKSQKKLLEIIKSNSWLILGTNFYWNPTRNSSRKRCKKNDSKENSTLQVFESKFQEKLLHENQKQFRQKSQNELLKKLFDDSQEDFLEKCQKKHYKTGRIAGVTPEGTNGEISDGIF